MQFTQITMNRHLNQAALEQIHAMLSAGDLDEVSTMQLRQAAYLHAIVAAMLTNQVHRLPEAAPIQR